MSYASLHSVFAAGAAARAAAASGLLHAVVERPGTAAELAGRCDVDPVAASAVLELLATFGVVVRDGDRFAPSEALVTDLRGPSGRPGVLSTMYDHLEDWLQTGRSLVGAGDRGAVYAGVTPALRDLFEPAAIELAHALDGDPDEILDVGAGTAVWSVAMLARHTGSRAVALDLAPVLQRAVEHAAARGVGDRLATMPGDFHDVELTRASFDRILLANVLHLEPAERARELVRRVRPALRPGGQLVIVDAVTDGTAAGDRERAAYALNLALRIPGGHPHHPEVIAGWMRELGLETRVVALCQGPRPMGALVAW